MFKYSLFEYSGLNKNACYSETNKEIWLNNIFEMSTDKDFQNNLEKYKTKPENFWRHYICKFYKIFHFYLLK